MTSVFQRRISLTDLFPLRIMVLGRISIGGNSAKVEGNRVGLVKLELINVFGEGKKNLVLGFGSPVLDLTDLHGRSFAKGSLVTFCGLISKCTTLKAGKLSSVAVFKIIRKLESYKK
jgi:hypothetical protein